jgi:hypothetical protein
LMAAGSRPFPRPPTAVGTSRSPAFEGYARGS